MFFQDVFSWLKVWIEGRPVQHLDGSIMKPCFWKGCSVWLIFVLVNDARFSLKKTSSGWDHMWLENPYPSFAADVLFSRCTSHPSIHPYLFNPKEGHGHLLEPIPALPGSTLDRLPVHHRAQMYKLPIQQTPMHPSTSSFAAFLTKH